MLDQLAVIVGVTVLVMLSPGPDMVIVLRNTLVGGRRAGLVTSLGILGGNLVHITYCAVGIGWLISQSIVAFNVLKYAGAAYVIYLGITSFGSKTTVLDAGPPDARHHHRGWFLQGFVNNLLNPKGTLFYLGVFTVVITPETSVFATGVLIAATISVSALFWLLFVVTLDRRYVRRQIERFQHAVNRIFGTLLVLLGIRVATID